MNPLTWFFVVPGLPLALLIFFVEKLRGKPTEEGFGDIARFIGVAYYCGVVTIIGLLALMAYGVWKILC